MCCCMPIYFCHQNDLLQKQCLAKKSPADDISSSKICVFTHVFSIDHSSVSLTAIMSDHLRMVLVRCKQNNIFTNMQTQSYRFANNLGVMQIGCGVWVIV